MAEIVFWLSLVIVFYSYLGYGLVLWVWVKLRRLFQSSEIQEFTQFEPEVALLIAAYNEKDFIKAKMDNCAALDYPKNKLRVIFVTDGSKDGTPDIIRDDGRFEVLHVDKRAGKIMAMNRGMTFVKEPISVFCDANTLLNKEAIREVVKHFANPKTGCVAGEKRIIQNEAENASGAGEGLYWKYESTLKKWDSEVGTVVGAAGELFAVRTTLFEAVEPDTLLDDFMISLRIAGKGYKVVYEPKAQAWETPTADVGEELKRKIRICAGGIQSIIRLTYLLNPFKYGSLTFQYVSHRVLRWSLTPLLLAVLIPINIYLALNIGGIYSLFMAGQVMFYAAALMGWWLESRRLKVKVLFVPYYFFIMNLAVFLGLKRYLKGQQSVLWEKAKRAE